MKLQSTKPITLHLPEFDRVYLTLAGCGGTGSHLASGLATLALELNGHGLRTELMFIDPDTVEEKNVGRQLFSRSEIGQAKSAVLAQRIRLAYGLRVNHSVRPIGPQDTFGGGGYLNVVIGAVDNAPARQVIARHVEQHRGRLWWADCGNENHSGQVALGNALDPKAWQPALGMVANLPAPHVLYPDLVRAPKKQPRRSCADATPEQSLMVNRMVAAWALSMLHDFLLGALHYFAVAFDLGQGGARSYALEEATLKEI